MDFINGSIIKDVSVFLSTKHIPFIAFKITAIFETIPEYFINTQSSFDDNLMLLDFLEINIRSKIKSFLFI